MCLFFSHIGETTINERKFTGTQKLYAELSTGTVDDLMVDPI
jgi:hypothetical protein